MALGTMGPVKLPIGQRPTPGNLRYGLFNVAPPRQILAEDPNDANLPDHAMGGGMLYDPIGCGDAHLYDIVCESLATKDFDDNSPEIEALPWVVYASLVCGSLGYTPAYVAEKVGLRLQCSEQHAVEEALWTGSAGNIPFIADPAFAVDIAPAVSYPDITAAVAALEQYAYSTRAAGKTPYGYNAVLHANTAVHAYAAAANLVHTANVFGGPWGAPADEPMLRTALGSKWVFGGGYPGTGPAGAPAPGAGQTYMFITGNVAVWRDPQWAPPDVLRSQFDRTLNQLKVIAERRYLASVECFSAYVLVDIPQPPA